MNSIEWLVEQLWNYSEPSLTNKILIDKAKEMHYKELMELQEKENNRIGFRERNALLLQQTLSDKYQEYKDWLNEIPEISDEEIEKASWDYEPRNKFDAAFLREAFMKGCEWYRKQLKQRQ